jgi:hypothetical protein
VNLTKQRRSLALMTMRLYLEELASSCLVGKYLARVIVLRVLALPERQTEPRCLPQGIG